MINDISAAQTFIDETVKEVEAVGRKSWGIVADVSNFDEVKRLVAETVEKSGRLDVMVANAGIAQVKALKDQTAEDLKRMFDVNVSPTFAMASFNQRYAAKCELTGLAAPCLPQIHGVANCYINAANAMIESGTKGRIIGAASVVAYKVRCRSTVPLEVGVIKVDPSAPSIVLPCLLLMRLIALQPTALLVPYSASKFAVRGLTQGAAMEWGKYGIRVVSTADLRSCILPRADVATASLECICTVSAFSSLGLLSLHIG